MPSQAANGPDRVVKGIWSKDDPLAGGAVSLAGVPVQAHRLPTGDMAKRLRYGSLKAVDWAGGTSLEAVLDGVRVFYHPVGSPSNPPLILLHGGPGLDHTEMHPWLDALSDTFHLIYMDLRGHGRGDRVDPGTLSLEIFSKDISLLAEALHLKSYAVLGHSYGSFVALTHALLDGRATHYVISGGTASMSKSLLDVEKNLHAFEPESLREAVTRSWAMEKDVHTEKGCRELWQMQMPFHFASTQTEAYRLYMATQDNAIFTPEILAHFAKEGYALECEAQLGSITRPTLVVTGEKDRTCTPRAARDMARLIPRSELAILPDAGHMTFVEQPELYLDTVRSFFRRQPRH